jgi:hypothetical protein
MHPSNERIKELKMQKNRRYMSSWKAYAVNDENKKFRGFIYARSIEEASRLATEHHVEYSIFGEPVGIVFWMHCLKSKL